MNRPDLKALGVGIVGYGQFGRFLHRAWGEAVCDQRQIDPFPGMRFRRRLEDLVGEREDDAADTSVAVASARVGEQVAFLLDHCVCGGPHQPGDRCSYAAGGGAL